MADVRMRSAVALLAVAIGGLLAGCGSGDGSADGAPANEPSETTALAPGDSGMFVVEPVPDGWAIDRAYAAEQVSSVSYAKGGDDDITFGVLAYTVDPSDPKIALMRQSMEDGENGVVPIEIDGHPAYRMPLSGDGRVYGDQIQWFARPDLVVSVQVPFDLGVDVEAVAADVHEISAAVRDDLVLGTSGGGEPAPPVEALRGTVDGDEWVLTAVLPLGYPVEPQDERRGCATLTFRDESATTCSDRFWTLDDATQVFLGGVNFGFGVMKEGSGRVELHQPENGGGPAHPTEAVVLPAAPELTWFVTTFDEVCDRYGLAPNGNSVIVGVPSGYPHRNDCAS